MSTFFRKKFYAAVIFIYTWLTSYNLTLGSFHKYMYCDKDYIIVDNEFFTKWLIFHLLYSRFSIQPYQPWKLKVSLKIEITVVRIYNCYVWMLSCYLWTIMLFLLLLRCRYICIIQKWYTACYMGIFIDTLNNNCWYIKPWYLEIKAIFSKRSMCQVTLIIKIVFLTVTNLKVVSPIAPNKTQ